MNMLINECVNIDKAIELKERFKFSTLEDDYNKEWTPPITAVEELLSMPDHSLGRELALHLLEMNKDQDPIHSIPATSRFPIRFPIRREIYIRDRLRQTHDILHILTNFNTTQPGEIALQGFYFGQRTNILSIMNLINTLSGFFIGEQDQVYIEAMTDGIQMGLKARKGCSFEHYEEHMEISVETIRNNCNIVASSGNCWNRS